MNQTQKSKQTLYREQKVQRNMQLQNSFADRISESRQRLIDSYLEFRKNGKTKDSVDFSAIRRLIKTSYHFPNHNGIVQERKLLEDDLERFRLNGFGE